MSRPPAKNISLLIYKGRPNDGGGFIVAGMDGKPLAIQIEREEYIHLGLDFLHDQMLHKLAENGCGQGYYILRNTNEKFRAVIECFVDEMDLIGALD